MANKACNLCGNELERIKVNEESDHNFRYDLYKCANCNFEVKYNYTDISDIYDFIYNKKGFIDSRLDHGSIKMDVERDYVKPVIDNFASKGVEQPRVLEIGPGTAGNLNYARTKNFITASLDISTTNNNYYKDKCKIDFVHNDLNEVQEEYYDVLIMTHVIEHISDPGEFMELVLRKVKVGGIVVVSTPNFNSLYKKLFGCKWWPYLIDDHVSFFSLKLLGSFLKQHHVDVIKCYSYGSNTSHSLSRYFNKDNSRPIEINNQVETSSQRTGKKIRIQSVIKKILDTITAPIAWFGLGYEAVCIGRKRDDKT